MTLQQYIRAFIFAGAALAAQGWIYDLTDALFHKDGMTLTVLPIVSPRR